jgi:hypothetical protein
VLVLVVAEEGPVEVVGPVADAGEGHGGDEGAVDAGDAEVPAMGRDWR